MRYPGSIPRWGRVPTFSWGRATDAEREWWEEETIRHRRAQVYSRSRVGPCYSIYFYEARGFAVY